MAGTHRILVPAFHPGLISTERIRSVSDPLSIRRVSLSFLVTPLWRSLIQMRCQVSGDVRFVVAAAASPPHHLLCTHSSETGRGRTMSSGFGGGVSS